MTDIMGDLNWLIWAGAAVLVLAIIWGVVQFAFKLTMKMFALGCLAILVAGLACGAMMFFSGGS